MSGVARSEGPATASVLPPGATSASNHNNYGGSRLLSGHMRSPTKAGLGAASSSASADAGAPAADAPAAAPSSGGVKAGSFWTASMSPLPLHGSASPLRPNAAPRPNLAPLPAFHASQGGSIGASGVMMQPAAAAGHTASYHHQQPLDISSMNTGAAAAPAVLSFSSSALLSPAKGGAGTAVTVFSSPSSPALALQGGGHMVLVGGQQANAVGVGAGAGGMAVGSPRSPVHLSPRQVAEGLRAALPGLSDPADVAEAEELTQLVGARHPSTMTPRCVLVLGTAAAAGMKKGLAPECYRKRCMCVCGTCSVELIFICGAVLP